MRNQKFFSAKVKGKEGVGLKVRHLEKYFVEKSNKKVPRRNILVLFLLVILKTTFSIENLTQGWTQTEPFFIFKKRRGSLPSLFPSCACVSVAEYA